MKQVRRAILLCVVIEAMLISLLGGVAGVLLALPVNGISTGTTNFHSGQGWVRGGDRPHEVP